MEIDHYKMKYITQNNCEIATVNSFIASTKQKSYINLIDWHIVCTILLNN